MSVSDVTLGGPSDPFRARFRGWLRLDSEQAYERLAASFAREDVQLMMHEQAGQHVILALPAARRPGATSPWLHLGLFLLTFASLVFTGIGQDPEVAALLLPGMEASQIARVLLANWTAGLPYAASLMAILLAHEFGHYFAARYHGTDVSLPFFIPLPGSLFGTLGAAIAFRERPRNRRTLLDIGIAGPLAGLAVAIPLLVVGLSLSPVEPLPDPGSQGGLILEGNSLLYLGLKYLVKGELLPAPADFAGMPPVLYWIRYFFLGIPAPLGGRDVLLHPMAWAGWAGLLVTALNLIPLGQLDGGHNIYALLGQKAARLRPFALGAMLLLGLVWSGWWFLAFVTFLLLRAYAIPMDSMTELDPNRRLFSLLTILIFIPVPLAQF